MQKYYREYGKDNVGAQHNIYIQPKHRSDGSHDYERNRNDVFIEPHGERTHVPVAVEHELLKIRNKLNVIPEWDCNIECCHCRNEYRKRSCIEDNPDASWDHIQQGISDEYIRMSPTDELTRKYTLRRINNVILISYTDLVVHGRCSIDPKLTSNNAIIILPPPVGVGQPIL